MIFENGITAMRSTPRPFQSPITLLLCGLGLLVGGCATDEEYQETADFGNSVRHMIALQTDTPGAPGPGMDAVKAQKVLNAYRDDVASPKRAERDIVLSVGE